MKGFLISAVGTAGALALVTGHGPLSHEVLSALDSLHASPANGKAAKVAVAYAEKQTGKPYLWGGTGPDAFDCSGLVWAAYRDAGVTIPRRSQDQWDKLPHIPASQRHAGDIEFIVGSDGTLQHPGHEVLLISRNKAIEAYIRGTTIRVISLKNPPPGDQNVVGFADPAGG